MANPNPKTDHLPKIQPGETRNPNGSSARQRFTTRMHRLLDERNLDDTILVTWLGAALGDESLLEGRKPNFAFFKELLDRLDGPVASKVEAEVKQAGGKVLRTPGSRRRRKTDGDAGT